MLYKDGRPIGPLGISEPVHRTKEVVRTRDPRPPARNHYRTRTRHGLRVARTPSISCSNFLPQSFGVRGELRMYFRKLSSYSSVSWQDRQGNWTIGDRRGRGPTTLAPRAIRFVPYPRTSVTGLRAERTLRLGETPDDGHLLPERSEPRSAVPHVRTGLARCSG